MLKSLYLVPTIMLLSACQPMHLQQRNLANTPIEDISSRTVVQSSEFDRCPAAKGAQVTWKKSLSENLAEGTSDFATVVYHIRSWLCDTPRHQIYVSFNFDDTVGESWRFYNGATDTNATPLNFTEIGRNVRCVSRTCYYNEDVGINLTSADFKKFQQKGFRFRVSAKSGHKTVLNIPARYFQGYALGLAKE